jgi:hypothetical protein
MEKNVRIRFSVSQGRQCSFYVRLKIMNKTKWIKLPTTVGKYMWRLRPTDDISWVIVHKINGELFFRTGASSLRVQYKGGEWAMP